MAGPGITVPGFDHVVTIKTPLWADLDDIFHFSQAYLLYFCLQAKMYYHFTDRVQSSTFLHAIQHLDYADTIKTLQSHMNSYCEDYNTSFLPLHLRLHGLVKSIHLNAQAWLRDIAVPRIQRLDYGCSLVQGIPLPAGPYSPSINRLGHPERNVVGFRDNNRDGNGGGGYRGAH